MPEGRQEFIALWTPKIARWLDSERKGAGAYAQTALAACGHMFQVNTVNRMGMLGATILHESGKLTIFEENLNYSDTGLMTTFPKYFPTIEIARQYAHHPQMIANRVYANRMGNGDEKSGDGWRYRGRGPIQITGEDGIEKLRCTGHEAYKTQSGIQGTDLLGFPDRLTEPGPGIFWAVWWWNSRNLNAKADADDMKGCTRIVNGGYNGLEDRLALYARAKVALA